MEHDIFVLNSTQELLILFEISDFRFLYCILSFLSHEAMDALFPQLSKYFPLGHNLFFFCIFVNSIFTTHRKQETNRCQVERNHSNLTYPHVFFLHAQNPSISPCLDSLASLKNSHNPQIIVFQYSSPRNFQETSWLHTILGPE